MLSGTGARTVRSGVCLIRFTGSGNRYIIIISGKLLLHLWSSHSPKLWWMRTSSRHWWRNRPDRQQHILVQCPRSSFPFELAYCNHGNRWIRLCSNYVHILFPSVSNLVFSLKPHLPDQNLVSSVQGSTTDLFSIPGFASFPSLANPVPNYFLCMLHVLSEVSNICRIGWNWVSYAGWQEEVYGHSGFTTKQQEVRWELSGLVLSAVISMH